MRKSVSASLEARFLEILREVVPDVKCVGLLATADAGKVKDEDLTSFQVRVYEFKQPNEATAAFTVKAEVRLNVEQAESANGGLFFDAHERFALWLERVMLGRGAVTNPALFRVLRGIYEYHYVVVFYLEKAIRHDYRLSAFG